MTFGSLFAGIGGFDLGLERAGMECAWQVEIEDFPRRVLEAHWPGLYRPLDVCDVGGENLEPVDLICGGFPCQDLSVAGKRAGLAGERSGLFYEFARIIDGLAPRWVLIENVPGLLSSNGGRDMGAVLGTLAELGYGYAYRVLDAQFFGVAQRRRRVFIVGCLGDAASAAQVLFEPESSSGDTPPSRSEGAGIARGFEVGPGSNRLIDIAPTLDTRCKDGPIRNQLGRGVLYVSAISGTLRAKGAQWDHDGDESKLVVAGYQGGDLSHALRSQASRADKPSSSTYVIAGFCYKAGAKAGSIGYSEEQSPTLKTETNDAAVHGPFGVRRLTPTECERLQGFPDGWTAIDGENTPDSPRYKAIGNAVCVNVAEWIGRRIIREESAL